MTRSKKNLYSAWLFWGLAALCFFSEYLARVSPGVMVPELMRDFNVTALALGSLSAFFYYAYVSMQIPVGVLVDRYGPRRLLSFTTFICGVGCLLFATAKSVYYAELGRLLMGFGAAFAFVSALKLATVWFPAQQFGLLAGLTQALGMLGASVGQAPVSYAVGAFGWRHSVFYMAILFAVLALLIAYVVRDKPAGMTLAGHELATGRNLLAGLRTVITQPQSWLNAIYAGLLYSPTAVIAELWGVSFFSDAYLLTKHQAAFGVGLIFIGWGVGGPAMGWLSDRIGQRRPILISSVLMSLVLLSIIIYSPHLSLWQLFPLLFFYGVFNTGVATAYAVAAEIVPRSIAGTSMAFANMASVIVGAAFQPIIGWLLDHHWNGQLINGIRQYSAADYRSAFYALPICLLIGFVLSYFIKETYCRGVEEI